MALYAYKCEDCPNVFEELLKKPQDTYECPTCGKPSKKFWAPDSPPLPIFNVTGFYTTDYKKANSNPGRRS